jgi:Mlc titration factor MtfA (ptsG expression regulator)
VHLLDTFFVFGLIIFIFASLRKEFLFQQAERHKVQTIKSLQSTTEYIVYHGSELVFTDERIVQILIAYNTYYRRLSTTQQVVFLQRLKQFICQKTFIIHGEKVMEEMPVLIAAASVKITFGIKHFEMPWFQYIQVYNGSAPIRGLRLLSGSTDGNSVAVSWPEELNDKMVSSCYEDVGIYEMSHALYMLFFYSNTTLYTELSNCFITETDHQNNRGSGDGENTADYSQTTLVTMQENWAEAVEQYFKNPYALSTHHAQLYAFIGKILRQQSFPFSEAFVSCTE